MRHRANAAQTLHHHRDFPVRPAFDEFLEAAEFDDMQTHLLHALLIVEQDRDLAVAFDTRHRIDGDTAQARRVGGGLEVEAHGGLLSGTQS